MPNGNIQALVYTAPERSYTVFSDPDHHAPQTKPIAMSWAAWGVFQQLQAFYPTGEALFTKAALEELLQVGVLVGKPDYKRITDDLKAHGILRITSDPNAGGRLIAYHGPRRPVHGPNGPKCPQCGFRPGPFNNYPEGVVATPPTESTKPAAKPHSGEAAGREAPSRRRFSSAGDNLGNKRRRSQRHAGAEYLAAAERVCQETLGKHPASMSYTVAMMVTEFDFTVADATQWLIARGSRATGRRGQSLKKADVRHALENPPLPVPDTPPAGHTPPPVDAETARATLAATTMHAPTKAGLLELLRVRPDAAAIPNLNQRFLQEVLSLDWEPTAAQVCAGVRRLARAREVDLTMLGSEMWSAREDAMAW